jgi:spore maturation protein CgeB
MKINIISPSVHSVNTNKDGANVQGDEIIARAWQKYLALDDRVDQVTINGFDNIKYDVCLSFTPLAPSTNGYQVLYLQNVFPKPAWPGTVEVYKSIKQKYNSFIFPSPGLKERCGEGLVSQFAVDPELFNPAPAEKRLAHNCCFVGNNIRDKTTTEKYILAARDKGLVVYGNQAGWNDNICVGKISLEDERILYSSSKVCLNAHLDEHLEYGSFNFRIFNILACKGFLISDYSPYLENEFKDCIAFTEGYNNLIEQLDYFLNHPEATDSYRQLGYKKVLEKHTFNHRVKEFLSWIEGKL